MRPPALGDWDGAKSASLESLPPNVSRVCCIFGGFVLDTFAFALCLEIFCCFEALAIVDCHPTPPSKSRSSQSKSTGSSLM